MAAIKHTHHALNARREGDTGKFLEAGALPAILAGSGEAIVFDAHAPQRVTFNQPADLLDHVTDASIVFVEGFKTFTGWPRIDAERVRTVEEALGLLDRIA